MMSNHVRFAAAPHANANIDIKSARVLIAIQLFKCKRALAHKRAGDDQHNVLCVFYVCLCVCFVLCPDG